MPYNVNVPLPNQRISASQPLLLQNTVAINAVESVDHVPFNDALEGRHAKVSLVPEVAEPIFAGGIIGIYNFLNAVTANQELYIRRTGADGTPFTAHRVYTPADPLHQVSHDINWFYLPCGYLVKFGQNVTDGAAFVNVNMNNGLNATEHFSAIPYVFYCLSAQPNTPIHLIMTALSMTNVAFNSEAPAKNVFWVAIGPV